MIIEDSIKIKNYKCFGEDPQGFDKIYPINIIIGKNNSGKSSLIDLVKFIVQKIDIQQLKGRNLLPPEIHATKILGEELRCFQKNTRGGDIPFNNHFDYGQTLLGGKVTYSFLKPNVKEILHMEKPLIPAAESYKSSIASNIKVPIENKVFLQITAERDIVAEPETNNSPISVNKTVIRLKPNGNGATFLTQFILNRYDYDRKIIDKRLLDELNAIVNPEIEFVKIFTQVDSEKLWEIYFEDKNGINIPLSKMGSGIKTILLVLLNLIVIPEVEENSKANYVFAFEELENNLHPALLRRLFTYIKKYSEEHKTYFFITTHSNVVIDFFGNDKNAQIVHVKNDGKSSMCYTASTSLHNKHILRDLDVRASDLLQSNGIIWVEGPSDRIYINKWVSLIEPDFQEGLHYSIMFYGGRLLSNLDFKEAAEFSDELISLIKINTNAFVIMDRDGESSEKKINQTKQRIITEIGSDKSWVTHGREIENYLTDTTLNNWLSTKHEFSKKVINNIDTKLEDNIANSEDSAVLKYDAHKKTYAIEIAEFITAEDLNHNDLQAKMDLLVKNIKEWNAMS